MRFGIVVLALAVTGCGSSIEGEWEAEGNGCGDLELTVLEDGKAEMTFPNDPGTGCFDCEFEGDYEEKDNGDFEFDLSPQSPCVGPDLEGECTLSDDGEELSCESNFGEVDFEKQN